MKKIISILLSLLIFVSSTGVTVAMHYCPMSKKTTFSLNETKTCCGEKATKKMENKCCKNMKVQLEKIKDSYTPAQISKTPTPEFAAFVLAFVQSLVFSLNDNQGSKTFYSDHSPPDKPVSLTILYRSILI